MPIFEQGATKILFLHIPKTGGTSIENMLKKHVDMSFYSPVPPSGLKITPQHLQMNDFRILFNNFLGTGFLPLFVIHMIGLKVNTTLGQKGYSRRLVTEVIFLSG
jgi:hypothetical protein